MNDPIYASKLLSLLLLLLCVQLAATGIPVLAGAAGVLTLFVGPMLYLAFTGRINKW